MLSYVILYRHRAVDARRRPLPRSGEGSSRADPAARSTIIITISISVSNISVLISTIIIIISIVIINAAGLSHDAGRAISPSCLGA